jgi:hypothetical protein
MSGCALATASSGAAITPSPEPSTRTVRDTVHRARPQPRADVLQHAAHDRGTPARTKTLPMVKPGGPCTGFFTSTAAHGHARHPPAGGVQLARPSGRASWR